MKNVRIKELEEQVNSSKTKPIPEHLTKKDILPNKVFFTVALQALRTSQQQK